ncbi:MAG TPA: GNAT family N-acetyltransferase [Vicinamibacterales bacterium]|jgi:GNAT superfamily N-acetyltransferase|nr:GNAT family N-acetyltransferase [Vicinamibacterales bacterium]
MSNGIVIRRVPATDADAAALMRALDADLQGRYPEAHLIAGLDAADAASERLIVLVAYEDVRPMACGAVRELDATTGEVKRMFVVPERRGHGLGRAILDALESHARAEGYSTLKIETGTKQGEAIALYRSFGYRDIPPFGKYAGNAYSMCFEKDVLTRRVTG